MHLFIWCIKPSLLEKKAIRSKCVLIEEQCNKTKKMVMKPVSTC